MTDKPAGLSRVPKGSLFNRLCDPAWGDPLDTSYSAKAGGRWNKPGDSALYLNSSDRMARLQADHKVAGQPYGIEDLDPAEQHDLIEITVDRVEVADCASAAGIDDAGLPATYPLAGDGTTVGHAACQSVADEARGEGLDGVFCRSAVRGASSTDTELAIFDPPAGERVTMIARRPFDDWYLGSLRP